MKSVNADIIYIMFPVIRRYPNHTFFEYDDFIIYQWDYTFKKDEEH
jgi:hypothetical protein